jgi:hypothetical protein
VTCSSDRAVKIWQADEEGESGGVCVWGGVCWCEWVLEGEGVAAAADVARLVSGSSAVGDSRMLQQQLIFQHIFCCVYDRKGGSGTLLTAAAGESMVRV